MPEREPNPERRRRRRRGPPRKPPESAVAVIAAAKPAVDVDKPADVPLTPAEAAEMRVHLRFLKEHRKILSLKVNAAEDLLLNGAREPTIAGSVSTCSTRWSEVAWSSRSSAWTSGAARGCSRASSASRPTSPTCSSISRA